MRKVKHHAIALYLSNKMKSLLLIATIVSCAVCCHGDEDFIDPFDMENFDPVTKTMIKTENKKTEEDAKIIVEKETVEKPATEDKNIVTTTVLPPSSTVKDQSLPPPSSTMKDQSHTCKEKNIGSVLLKKFVKQFLSYFEKKAPEVSTEEYHLWVKLSKTDYTLLKKFSKDQASIHDAHEVLMNMMTGVTRSDVGTTAKFSLWFEEKTSVSLDSVLKVITIIALVSMVLYLEIGLHVSWRRKATQVILLAFVISIPMTWYELYKTAQINQQTVTMKEAPKECVQDIDEDSLLSVYVGAFKHLFTFQKDNCQHYYEHLLIDPLLKVTPTKAIAVTFVRFFLSPLKDVGTACSEFMRALFIDLPVTMYPIAIVTVGLFFFLFLFMWFGYSIRLPFFLSIEPSPVLAVTGSSGDSTPALEAVQKQLEALQDAIQASETRTADELRRMAEVQTRSIEYTVGAVTSNVAPPTLGPAIKQGHSHISFDTKSNDVVDIKSPIPCSDDSFSEPVTTNIHQETSPKIMQESVVDNIGPDVTDT